MLYLLDIRNNIIEWFFGKIIDKVIDSFEKIGLTPFVFFSVPIIVFSVWFLLLFSKKIKTIKTRYEKAQFIFIFILVLLGLCVCVYCIIIDQKRISHQL